LPKGSEAQFCDEIKILLSNLNCTGVKAGSKLKEIGVAQRVLEKYLD